jgi:hypothetical protein
MEQAIEGARVAYNHRDAEAACSYMTPAGQQCVIAASSSGEAEPATTCADAVGAEFPQSPIHVDLHVNIDGVSVAGDRATVRLADARTPANVITVNGIRTPGGWRLDSTR